MIKKTGIALKSTHYNIGKIQPIDLIVEQRLNFIEGSIVKYVCRYKFKGTPMQDLLKAQQYLQWLIELQKEKKECK